MFYFRLTQFVFPGQQKVVNTGSDWPFFVMCSGLQRNHDVFLALAALYRFQLAVFPHVFCAPSVIKRLIRCLLHGNNSMAKRGSDSPCASSAKRKKYAARYKPEWVTDLQFKCHSDKGPTFAYCRVCNMHINVAYGGKSDIVHHASSASHCMLQKSTLSKIQPQMQSFYMSLKTTELLTNVLSAEVKFAQFVAEHNLSFSVADHFTKLAKQLFPDSDIAGKFSSGRMKTTMIVKNALAPRLDANIVKLCQNNQFSLLTDESNDRGSEKTLVILVKVFDPDIARAVTRFVDIPVCNISTAANISAVFRPSKQLPLPVEELLIDVYFHFNHSAKRKEEYREFLEFCDVAPLKILKYAVSELTEMRKPLSAAVADVAQLLREPQGL